MVPDPGAGESGVPDLRIARRNGNARSPSRGRTGSGFRTCVLGVAAILLLTAGCTRCEPAFAPVPRPFDSIGGIWISRAELMALPTAGPAWEALREAAQRSTDSPDLSDQEDMTNVRVMAKALVYARTGDDRYRQEVIRACLRAIGTEARGRTLSLGRELAAYVIAADLVGLPAEEDARFRRWLSRVRTRDLRGRSLRSTHEDRPNNWGNHAGASRIAVALYLQDNEDLERAARVFRGYLGDRAAWSKFEYGALDWQADPGRPVGINPKGARLHGKNVDGVLPDDQRRCCTEFEWPAPKENYVYEGLQGALASAVMLHRAGYDVWHWEDDALLRAFRWLYEIDDFPAVGDDTWQPYLINFYYGADFPTKLPTRAGKNVGYTDWTHGPDRPRRAARDSSAR